MENNKDDLDTSNILRAHVERTLKNVITISSNLNNDLECIILERRSESSLSVGKDSANLLVDFMNTSAKLLSNLKNYETSEESTQELNDEDLGAPHKTVEYLNNYIKRQDEFNKYIKMITMGIKKMAVNNKSTNNDSERSVINSTTLSDDFDFSNLHLASSSPMPSSRK